MIKTGALIKRIWKKVLWTARLVLLGATPLSAVILAYRSCSIPLRNRMGKSLSPYSVRIRKNDQSCVLHFSGTYDELLVLTEVFLNEAYKIPVFVERYGIKRIIDAGANAGFVSAYYALMYPDAIIHAYEPSETVLTLLEKNVSGFRNVTLCREAISSEDGKINFHQDTNKNIASSVFERGTSTTQISVPSVSLDTAISRIGGETVIKMDIEGAEFSVIEACRKKEMIVFITGEAHGDIARKENTEIEDMMKETHSVNLSPLPHVHRAIFSAVRFGVPISVTYVLPSLIVGGIEKQFVRQMKAINRQIISPSLVTLFEYEGRETLYSDLDDVKIVRLSGNGLFSYLRKIFALKHALVELHSDVVVSSMFSGNACAAVACWLSGIPHVPREHNTYEEKTQFQNIFDRWIIKHSFRCVAVSHAVAKFASNASGVPVSPYAVIGNGVDIVDVDARLRKKACEDIRIRLGIGMDESIILNVARLKKAKNQFALIEAFSKFSEKNADTRLLLVGDGDERPTIDDLIASLGLQEKILRLGHRNDVTSIYMSANVFVLPSMREGFPNVALEAMSYGLPVIMTKNIGGQMELVEDGVQGFLCGTDADSIERALHKWNDVDEKTKQAIKNAALEKAKDYSIQSIVAEYTQLFVDTATRRQDTIKTW